MDYGKFKYEEAQKAKEARRNQANTILKEVRFRLKIDVHDYETKMKRAVGFLQAGDKVKAMILFRGREQSRPDQGVRLLQRFAEDVAEFGSVESTPTIDGRNMVMVIGPHKTKAAAKAEADSKKSSKPARAEGDDAETPVEKPAAKAPVKTEAPLAEFIKAAPRAAAPASAPRTQAPRTSAPAASSSAPSSSAPSAAPAADKPAAKAAPAASKAAPASERPAAPKVVAPKMPAPKPANAAAMAKVAAAKPAPKKD